MSFYAIREVPDYMYTPTQSLAKVQSRPVDKIMVISGNRHSPGFYEYPKDVYTHLTIIHAWEYDMLHSFGVPEVEREFIDGLDKTYGPGSSHAWRSYEP